jgi:hypothetical protein
MASWKCGNCGYTLEADAPPVIRRIVRLKESIKGYKKREKCFRTTAVKLPRNWNSIPKRL